MDTKKILRECKKLSKELIDNVPSFKLDSNWNYNFDTEEIGVDLKPYTGFKETENIVLDYFKKMTGTDYHSYTYALVHELGHYFSHVFEGLDREVFYNGAIKHKALQLLVRTEMLSYEEALEVYYQEKSEVKANSFLKKVFKSCKEEIENFNKAIVELTGA